MTNKEAIEALNVFPHRSFTVCGSQAVNVWNRRDDNATD
nr:MAG TPA: hypothetical protein [Caudoviricetes sp.]